MYLLPTEGLWREYQQRSYWGRAKRLQETSENHFLQHLRAYAYLKG